MRQKLIELQGEIITFTIGDLKIPLSEIDRTCKQNQNECSGLEQYHQSTVLVDIYRKLHPTTTENTLNVFKCMWKIYQGRSYSKTNLYKLKGTVNI
jgi:hypothetical protein